MEAIARRSNKNAKSGQQVRALLWVHSHDQIGVTWHPKGFFETFKIQNEEVHSTEEEHKAKLSHELIAGAASYEAVKAYNEHCEKNGKPNDHAKALEILAGFSGALVDRLVETKGLDFIDRQKAKRHAEEQVKQYYEEEHN